MSGEGIQVVYRQMLNNILKLPGFHYEVQKAGEKIGDIFMRTTSVGPEIMNITEQDRPFLEEARVVIWQMLSSDIEVESQIVNQVKALLESLQEWCSTNILANPDQLNKLLKKLYMYLYSKESEMSFYEKIKEINNEIYNLAAQFIKVVYLDHLELFLSIPSFDLVKNLEMLGLFTRENICAYKREFIFELQKSGLLEAMDSLLLTHNVVEINSESSWPRLREGAKIDPVFMKKWNIEFLKKTFPDMDEDGRSEILQERFQQIRENKIADFPSPKKFFKAYLKRLSSMPRYELVEKIKSQLEAFNKVSLSEDEMIQSQEIPFFNDLEQPSIVEGKAIKICISMQQVIQFFLKEIQKFLQNNTLESLNEKITEENLDSSLNKLLELLYAFSQAISIDNFSSISVEQFNDLVNPIFTKLFPGQLLENVRNLVVQGAITQITAAAEQRLSFVAYFTPDYFPYIKEELLEHNITVQRVI